MAGRGRAASSVFRKAASRRPRICAACVVVRPSMSRRMSAARELRRAPPCLVESDAVQPGPEPCATLEAADGPPGAQERLLAGLFGVGGVAAVAQHDRVQAVAVAADEFLERLAAAVPGEPDELFVLERSGRRAPERSRTRSPRRTVRVALVWREPVDSGCHGATRPAPVRPEVDNRPVIRGHDARKAALVEEHGDEHVPVRPSATRDGSPRGGPARARAGGILCAAGEDARRRRHQRSTTTVPTIAAPSCGMQT